MVIEKLYKHKVNPHKLQDNEEYWHDGWNHLRNMDLMDELEDIISTLDAKDLFPKFTSHNDKILYSIAIELYVAKIGRSLF